MRGQLSVLSRLPTSVYLIWVLCITWVPVLIPVAVGVLLGFIALQNALCVTVIVKSALSSGEIDCNPLSSR